MSIKYRFGKSFYRTLEEGLEREWLMSNGLGGFSSCSIIGNCARIHSGYLIASLNPPVDRINILAKTNETIVTGGSRYDLSCQQYEGGRPNDIGFHYLEEFLSDAVPSYVYQIRDIRLKKTIAMEYGRNTSVICYELNNGSEESELHITPLFTLRDNSRFNPAPSAMTLSSALSGDSRQLTVTNSSDTRYTVTFTASAGSLALREPKDQYITGIHYAIDARNGSAGTDTCYTPCDIVIKLKPGEYARFYLKCTIEGPDEKDGFKIADEYKDRLYSLLTQLKHRDDLTERLAVSADTFIVKRASTGLKTILAGFPWFTDWGRDTMIALQGLTLCTGRYKDAEEILESFSLYLKNGLIPNMFPSNAKENPYYNTVDASLWYFYSVDRYLAYTGSKESYSFIEEKIYPVLKQIIESYKQGTDFSIHMDKDGLISAGSDLDQITWMDVRVGDWVVTPRHGKPVEINALWYNALKVMEKLASHFEEDAASYHDLAKQVSLSFNQRFWNKELGCLYDVVDENDPKIRPNQIWAVSLPYTMLDRKKEKQIIDVVYKHLYTVYGLRTLSDTDADYKGSYIGPLAERDAAYHMGTAWPFPVGGFITAYVKVHDYSPASISRAREMCEVFLDHMQDGCLNGIAEVFSGTNTCTGNGCYNQAWSVGEILRAYTEDVLS